MEDKTEPSIDSTEETAQPKGSSFFVEVLKFFFIILFVIVPFRVFVAQPFIVEGASMDPNFDTGNYLIVDQLSYRLSDPDRGSVLVFKHPLDNKQFLIKRIIGLPGETVEMGNGIVTIINEENPEGFVYDQPYVKFKTTDNKTLTLSTDEYFVLGDNRPVSSDSRAWGAVDRDEIIGRPFFRLLPLKKISIFPGDFSE
jgi:signal peptidase I